jgi:general secretion pathway protein G
MKKQRMRGFSLLEIMIALAIVGLIVGIVAKGAFDSYLQAQISTAQIQIREIDRAVELHRLVHKKYPTTAEGLTVVKFEDDRPPPPDPWDGQYGYAAPGAHNVRRFDVSSDGPDRRSGTEDDLGNWQRF